MCIRDRHGDALLVRLVGKGLFFAFDGIKARYVKVRIRVFLGDAAEPSWIAGNTDFSITAGAQMRNVAGDLTSSVVDRDRCIERTMSPGRDRFALHDLLACRYGHVQGKRDVYKRQVQQFLGQNFHVAKQFTGQDGSYVKLEDTIRSFDEILKGNCDEIPEQCFRMKGGIEDVYAAYEQLKNEE